MAKADWFEKEAARFAELREKTISEANSAAKIRKVPLQADLMGLLGGIFGLSFLAARGFAAILGKLDELLRLSRGGG